MGSSPLFLLLCVSIGCWTPVAAVAAAAADYNRTYRVTDEVWFQVEIHDLYGKGNYFRGNFTVALFGEVVPLTVRNFVEIARGFKKPGGILNFRGSPIHRIAKELLIQTGDITTLDGTGGRSIYGDSFVDENFILEHRSPGWVSMASRGPDQNNSQFFVMLTKAKWLDGLYVVFGKVIRGFTTILTVAEQKTDSRTQRPVKTIRILNCGINQLSSSYVIPANKLDSTADFKPGDR